MSSGEPPHRTIELPHTYGKYELLELVGEGGMASVYRASKSGPGGFRKQVALKLLKPGVSELQQVVDMLIDEARLGGLLQHANLVEVHEFDRVDGQYYMAIEYVDGPTLAALLRTLPEGQGFPPRIVARIALQICQGLAYAHTARDDRGEPMNLVHRDLKPANVMIRRDGVIKIADFGIAKAATNLTHTQTGLTRGTPSYMSPEQALGAVEMRLDHRSDLFSLATVLTEALTGELTFDAPETLTVLNLVASADVQHALKRVWELAPPFVPILERAFCRQPDDRFADAVEMGRRIRAIHDELPAPQPDLAAWIAERMGAPEPVSLDREIAPLTATGGPGPVSLRERLPEPEPTVPSVRTPPDRPAPPVRRPPTSKAPVRARRSGMRLELGVVAFAIVGLLGGLYLSANDWRLPGQGEPEPSPPPAEADVYGDLAVRTGSAAVETEPSGSEPVEAAAAAPSDEPVAEPVDLGLGKLIGDNLRLKRCVRKHHKDHETFAPVEVTFTVTIDGKVEGAALASPDAVDPEFGACLVDGVNKLRVRGQDLDEAVRQSHVFRPQ